jgi:hypothetical protein
MAIDISEFEFREEDLGPLKIAKTTDFEYIPGMREQGKGVKISCPHDYGVLKTALIGNAGSIFIPDPDQPEMHNLLSASGSKEFMDFLRQHKGRHMAISFPEHYEKMKHESDMLAKTYRDNGVRLIRNETNTITEELLAWQIPVTGDMHLSLYGQSGGEVFDNIFMSMWEVGAVRGIEFQHRDAFLEIFENDPGAIWMTMPMPAPTGRQKSPQPFLSPGDPRIMPDKLVIIGIGVTDPAHIKDPTKPRSSGFEIGADMMRRMLEPFGWRVETVYFNSKYTYHIDCLMMQIDEGIYAIPETNPDLGPPFWTDLPKEIKDKWECVEIPFEDQQNGGCNTVTLGNGKFVIDEACERSMEILAKKGYTPIPTPWQANWHTFHSGVHCSTLRLMAE